MKPSVLQTATRAVCFPTIVGVSLTLTSCQGVEPPPASPPNIIIVLTDDQGYGDAGVHGNEEIRTPHLDRFAREGVEFSRFYVSPVCAPTRAALMTGRYYYRTGVIHTSRGGAKMHADEVTLAEMLRGSGYRTGIFGKWHLGDNYPMRPVDQGFEQALVHKSGGIDQTPDKPNDYFDPLLWKNGESFQAEGYCTDVFFEAAIEFIRDHRGEPFFVYLPTNAPHSPLIVADHYAAPYLAMGLDEETAKVYGMVQNIDENFGRLIETLDELSLRENTIVWFLSDNGPAGKRYNAGLRNGKGTTYEGGIRALSFLQWPAKFREASKIDNIAAHIDITPTVLHAADIPAPADVRMDGRSLLPLLEGRAEGWPRRTLFFQCHRGLDPEPYHNAAAVTDRYKLLMGPDTFSQERLDIDGEPPIELYDLETDPGESNNLAARRPDIVAGLKKQYDAWFEEVKSTRGFEPGVIHLGTEKENPAVLCRYQDSTYKNRKPTGWRVEIERVGRYELTIDRGEDTSPATMFVKVNGEVSRQALEEGEDTEVFELPAGLAVLDIWVQKRGAPRAVISDNSTLGNVVVRRLPEQ